LSYAPRQQVKRSTIGQNFVTDMFVQNAKGILMNLTEILPAIRQLPVLDKIRLIRILAEELDVETNILPFEPYKVYYLTTPYNMFGAGKSLMDAMRTSDNKSD